MARKKKSKRKPVVDLESQQPAIDSQSSADSATAASERAAAEKRKWSHDKGKAIISRLEQDNKNLAEAIDEIRKETITSGGRMTSDRIQKHLTRLRGAAREQILAFRNGPRLRRALQGSLIQDQLVAAPVVDDVSSLLSSAAPMEKPSGTFTRLMTDLADKASKAEATNNGGDDVDGESPQLDDYLAKVKVCMYA